MRANRATTAPDRGIIDRHVAAVYHPFAMLAGMKLDVFTPLAEGPRSAGALAAALDVDAAKLGPLLYALVAADLLTVEGGRFANTPVADRFLVRGRPDYMGGAHELYSELWHAALRTDETVRTGRPQRRHDVADMDEDDLRAFFRGMHAGGLAAGRYCAELLHLAGARHLLDVGGGSGAVCIAACQTCPQLRATLVEMPRVAAVAREHVAEAGLDERIRVVEGDAAAAVPAGPFDVALLRNVIQVLSAQEARGILHRVGNAVEPGGRLLIWGRVLDDSRLSPPQTVGFNLYFINLYDRGQAYTEAEHRQWLDEAGFDLAERRLLPDENSLLLARRR